MSAVAGIVDAGEVIIAGDSAASDDATLEIRKDPKVFELGPLVVGFAGSFRPGQAVRYRLIVPRRARGQDAFEYISTVFIDSIRAALLSAPPPRDTADDDNREDWTLLVGCDGRLFRIGEDWDVGECAVGFMAIGTGGDAATAALHAQDIVLANARRSKREFPYSAESRVLDALAVAERTTPSVRKPFVVVRSKRKRSR